VNYVPFICLICNVQVVVKASKIYHKDTEVPPCGVDDMTKLAYLHEPGVLNNLRSRYDINEIYVQIWIPNSPEIASVAYLCLLEIFMFSCFINVCNNINILLPDLHWEYIDCCEPFHKASSFI